MESFNIWLFQKPTSSLMLALVLSYAFHVHGEESEASRASPARQVLSLAIPPDTQLWDWVWEGTTIVSSEEKSGVRVIDILEFSTGLLASIRNGVYKEGEFPVLLGSGRVAYIREGRTVVVASLVDLVPTQQVDLGEGIGLIGEVTFASGSLWLHAIDAHTETPNPRIYTVDLSRLRVVQLGEGYYARTFDGSVLYFVDDERNFALYSVPLSGGTASRAIPTLVYGAHVYSPQVVSRGRMLVVQSGAKRPRIDLISADGKLVRCLSGDGRSGAYPRVSPSGKYVAFAHRQDGDYRATVVEVVDMEGNLVYQGLSGSHPISAAYRWSRDTDRLAVVVRDGVERKALEIVSFREETGR